MKLAQRIFEYRKQLNLSQEALSEKLNISRQSVSKWESDQATPDLEKLILLSQIFGVTLDDLVNDSKKELKNSEILIQGLVSEAQFRQSKRKNTKLLILLSILVGLTLIFQTITLNGMSNIVSALRERILYMDMDYNARLFFILTLN
jgi:transcriptional regulator with XRE-family HTH domain